MKGTVRPPRPEGWDEGRRLALTCQAFRTDSPVPENKMPEASPRRFCHHSNLTGTTRQVSDGGDDGLSRGTLTCTR